MKRIKYIPQFMQTECGLCCVAMIANYYGHHITLQDLREYQQPGRDGISAKSLCKVLDWINFEYRVFKCGSTQISNLSFPLIAFWEKSHFVVVEKVGDNAISVIDPALGRVIYTLDEFDTGFSGIVICPKPKGKYRKALRTKPDKSIGMLLWTTLLSCKRLFVGVTFFSLLAYIASLAIPLLVRTVIDSQNSLSTTLIGSGILVLFGYTSANLINSLLGVLLRTKVYRDFFKTTFNNLTNTAYSFFESRTVGSISYNLDCVDVIHDFYSGEIINVVISVGAFLVLSAYIVSISKIIYVVLILLLVASCSILILLNKRVAKLSQSELNGKEKLRELQLEFVSAVSCIKSGGLEQIFYDKWSHRFDETMKKTKQKGIAQALCETASASVLIVVPVIILFTSLYFVSTSDMTIGAAVSLYSVVTIVITNVENVVSAINHWELIRIYLERIKDVALQPCEQSGTHKIDNINCIEIKNLSFKYSLHAPMVLKNINMKFERGKKIAIVGGSGSGKSTIAKLLVQLYPITQGEILYDDIPAASLDKRSLKKILGVAAQDGTLFNRSILHNLTLLCESYEMNEVMDVCKSMNIYDDILAMPMKFDTILSEIGTNISGGQKQRLILSRLLLSHPQFLILDEATSALDAVTEQEIFSELSRRGCTQIVIAHRLSTIVDADYIYVLEEGTVVEEGTHADLIQHQGVYSKLYQSSQKTTV